MPDDADATLQRLRTEAAHCTACDLYRNATRTVFGEGPGTAGIVMVGEQPGDQEDRQGRPFVGPAGQLLDRALADAGVDRAKVYLTNAVKHFKFTPRGRMRMHQKPNAVEIGACHRWLEAELQAVRPALVVALGATAARAVLGRDVRIMSERGGVFDMGEGGKAFLTVHPSLLLRLPEPAQRKAEYQRFVRDLERLPELVPSSRAA